VFGGYFLCVRGISFVTILHIVSVVMLTNRHSQWFVISFVRGVMSRGGWSILTILRVCGSLLVFSFRVCVGFVFDICAQLRLYRLPFGILSDFESWDFESLRRTSPHVTYIYTYIYICNKYYSCHSLPFGILSDSKSTYKSLLYVALRVGGGVRSILSKFACMKKIFYIQVYFMSFFACVRVVFDMCAYLRLYRVAKTHRIPYLYRSFSAKEPCI